MSHFYEVNPALFERGAGFPHIFVGSLLTKCDNITAFSHIVVKHLHVAFPIGINLLPL